MLHVWKMAVQQPDVRIVCTKGMAGLTFISLPITFLFYPCAPAIFWPSSSNIFSPMAQLRDLFHSAIICQVTQLFSNQLPLYNHRDSKSQVRHTSVSRLPNGRLLFLSAGYTVTHCSAGSWQVILNLKKKKAKQTLFSNLVIFLQSNPRIVITQMQ